MSKPQPKRPTMPTLAPPTPDAPDSRRPTVTLRLTEDGNAIDWDAMRDTTRSKILDLTRRDAKLQPTTPADASVDVFTDRWCATMLDAIGKLEVSIVSRLYKVSMDHAAVMLYTDQDKAILSDPLRRVLNKYAGAWLGSHGDEAVLVAALVTIHVEKLQLLRETVERASHAPASIVSIDRNADRPRPEDL